MAGFPQVTSPARASNIIQVTGETDGAFDVFHDCARLARGTSAQGASAAIVAGLNNAAIALCPYFAVHGGVAGWEGGIVGLPAESGQGKTTLIAALVRQGLAFLSDEALVFDDEGKVLPYPKPLALSPWSARLVGQPVHDTETLVTASDLGGTVGGEGRLTDLVVSQYGHTDMALDPLPRSQAVAALIQYSFNHYKDPARAFRIATDVAREVRVWRLEYDDPLEAAALLAEKLR